MHSLDATDSSNTIAYAMFGMFLVVVAILRRDEMLGGLRSAWPALALVALAYLSAFWSDVPNLVLRRATTLAITTVFAVYLVSRFDLGRLVAMLVKLNAVAVVGSFAVAAVSHKLAVMGTIDYPTAWRGVYTSKNTLGGMSAVGIVIAVYALWRGYGSRLIAAAVIPGNMALLYLSQSATPIMLLLVTAYVAVTASAFRKRNAIGFAAGFALLLFGILGIALIVVGWTEVLTALGRSATLTGRTRIWHMTLDNIAQRPWLGYGFGAFWRQGEVEARTIWQILQWIVPHAHNLWLEIGLELGIVGMTGVTLVWIVAFYRGIRVLTAPGARHVVFCLAMLMAILIGNLTEYEFLRGGSSNWVWFVILFTYLGREALAARVIAARRPRAGALAGPVIAAPAPQR
jgi:O-antigen ligase